MNRSSDAGASPIDSEDGPEFCITDLPWHAHDMEDATLCGPDHLAIADFNARNRLPGENQANANFAMRAANCHLDLLEALKGYRAALLMGPLEIAAKHGPDFNPDDVVIEADKVALAAIAKAEGR